MNSPLFLHTNEKGVRIWLTEKKRNYFDLSNVEKQKNFLTAEEFPEGSYGSSIRKDEPVENKSTPWKKDSGFIVHLIMKIKRFIRIFLGKWTVLTPHTMTLDTDDAASSPYNQ